MLVEYLLIFISFMFFLQSKYYLLRLYFAIFMYFLYVHLLDKEIYPNLFFCYGLIWSNQYNFLWLLNLLGMINQT